MNTRSMKVQVRVAVAAETNSFEGRACQYGVVDSYGTTFTKGCFTKGGLDTKVYALLWQHNYTKPVGTLIAEERQDGLYIVGKWDENPQGQSARAAAMSGSASDLSVGFEWVDYESDNASTEIKEAKLMEVSQVTTRFGAVPGSKFVSARSGRVLSSDNEKALRDATELIESVLDQIDGTQGNSDDSEDEVILPTDEATRSIEDTEVDTETETNAANQRSRETLSLIARIAIAE